MTFFEADDIITLVKMGNPPMIKNQTRYGITFQYLEDNLVSLISNRLGRNIPKRFCEVEELIATKESGIYSIRITQGDLENLVFFVGKKYARPADSSFKVFEGNELEEAYEWAHLKGMSKKNAFESLSKASQYNASSMFPSVGLSTIGI